MRGGEHGIFVISEQKNRSSGEELIFFSYIVPFLPDSLLLGPAQVYLEIYRSQRMGNRQPCSKFRIIYQSGPFQGHLPAKLSDHQFGQIRVGKYKVRTSRNVGSSSKDKKTVISLITLQRLDYTPPYFLALMLDNLHNFGA